MVRCVRLLAICLMVPTFFGVVACTKQTKEDPAKVLLDRLDSLTQIGAFTSPVRKQTMIELAEVWVAEAGKANDPDSAAAYLMKASDLLGNNFVRQYDQSIDILTQVTNQYGQTSAAASAWFARGFIQNTELQNMQAARVAYTTFLEKYPDHPLAKDAEVELSTLGLSDEEQLERILAKKDSLEQGESLP